MKLKHLHMLNGVLAAGLWAFVILAYGALPDQIPQHIGSGGEVTRWVRRESGMWFLVPILIMTHLVIIYGIAASITTGAGMNVPHKKRLAALPREAQAFALQPVRTFLFAMATWLILVSWLVQYMLYRAAIDGQAGNWGLPALLVITLLPCAGAFRLSKAVGRRIDALEAAAPRGRDTRGNPDSPPY